MGQLVNIKAAYQLCNSLFGVDPDPDTFEDVALVGWEKIGNKHTRLYRYKANTKNKETTDVISSFFDASRVQTNVLINLFILKLLFIKNVLCLNV